ncbi:hypothetical protein [Parafrankia sp. EUN1f]|uniref:hypothetical protein n=1 Tax=Parafrankia sp. EUN1f TaxID=102897 RepID=UPI0001C45650|nr:hypothetical protein [Parafrankia sp. EUN1f]EFC82861.1 hypothetical protein FrEUN1fDRAFT_4058 [Parafrankia sp. EUN1f]
MTTEETDSAWGGGGFVPRTAELRRWRMDWGRWSRGADAADGLRRWQADPALAAHSHSLAGLLDACGRDRSVPLEVADGRLAALVAHARAGDSAAVRVVLERVLPALVVTAVRRAGSAPFGGGRGSMAFSDVLVELVAAGWEVICGYPLERRPRKIAVNVVRDTTYRVFGYVPIMERSTFYPEVLPAVPAGLDGRPTPGIGRGAGPGADLLETLSEAYAAGTDPAALRLLVDLTINGRSQAEIAAREGITDRTVRLRRDAAVRSVRSALGVGVRVGAGGVAV